MFSSAIVDCTAILANEPTCLKALKCRAECYERLGSWYECYNDAQRICAISNCVENASYLMKIRSMFFRNVQSKCSFNNVEAYETLGVSRNASIQEIKNAYKRLSLRFHPGKNSVPTKVMNKLLCFFLDKNLDQPPEVLAENAKQFHKVSEAYKTLTSHHSQ